MLTTIGDDTNHFSSEYFGNGLRWHLPMVERMARGFFRARETYRATGRNVINTTPNSMLDIFERAPFGLVTSQVAQCSIGGVTRSAEKAAANSRTISVAVGICAEELPMSDNTFQRYTQLFRDLSEQQSGSDKIVWEIHMVANSSPGKLWKTKQKHMKVLQKLCREIGTIGHGACTFHWKSELSLTSFQCQSAILETTESEIFAIVQAGIRIAPTWLQGIVHGFARDPTCWSMRGSITRRNSEPGAPLPAPLKQPAAVVKESEEDNKDVAAKLQRIRKKNMLSQEVNLCNADKDVPHHGSKPSMVSGNVAYLVKVPSCLGGIDQFLGDSGRGWHLGRDEHDMTIRIVSNGGMVCYSEEMDMWRDEGDGGGGGDGGEGGGEGGGPLTKETRYEEFKRFKRRGWTTTPKERRAWEELADAYLVCKHCNPDAKRLEYINKWMRTWKSTNKGEDKNVNKLSKYLYALVSMCGRRGIAKTILKDQSSDLSTRGDGTTNSPLTSLFGYKSLDSPLASLFGFCGVLLSCCLVGLCVSRFWSKNDSVRERSARQWT